MFRLWAKEVKNNNIIRDIVIKDERVETRTHKVFDSIEKICNRFDLSKPIWLNSTTEDFKKRAKCRFYKENFIDEVEFDYLEIQVLEEDEFYP